MPNLNIKDDSKKSFQRQPLSPFKRAPLAGGGSTTLHVMIGLGIVILIAVGVYLLNQFGYIHLWEKKTTTQATLPQQQAVPQSASVETSEVVASQPSPTTVTAPPASESKQTIAEKKSAVKLGTKSAVKPEKKTDIKVTKKVEPNVEKKAVPKIVDKVPESAAGEYAIFIGSFREKSKADEEAARWREAGYTATVSEKNKWFRLAIGKYNTKKEATEVAKKLSDAFEAGYWIDKVK
jgi:cell division protein FtsN